jgi:hypothetical protein
MINLEFADYRNEYEAIGIGEALYQLIYEIVKKTVKSYPPSIYSSNNVWDEDAISGLCHDFTMEKLLAAGWLEHYLLSLCTTEGLKSVIKRDFRHYLINKKVRTEKSNLYTRGKLILQTDKNFKPFILKDEPNDTIWGLAGWDEKDILQNLEELLRVLATIDLPSIIRYRPDSLKLSPLLSTPDLVRLIKLAFQRLDKMVAYNLLFEGLCYRLGIISEATVSLDDPLNNKSDMDDSVLADVISTPLQTESIVTSQDTANDIFERLSDRQRMVLGYFFELENSTLEDIGEHLGISKSTVGNELAVINSIISDSISKGDEAEMIITILRSVCAAHLQLHD